MQVDLPPLGPPGRAAAAAALPAATAAAGARSGDDAAMSDGGNSRSEGERAVWGDRGPPAGALYPTTEAAGMPEGTAAASAPPGGPAGGTGGNRAAEDDSADRGQRRRERMEEKRRRFGAETAARIGNGYVSAKMIRARLLHHAILRLLGALPRLRRHARDELNPEPKLCCTRPSCACWVRPSDLRCRYMC